MAVRIRMKKLGRRHRPYFRICVMDSRTPRDGKTIEEIGTYDPMIRETDKRVSLKADRVDYWLSVGAQPSANVKILIDKYKGKVPQVRVDVKKQREAIVTPQKAESRRKKFEPAPPPAAEAEQPAPAEEATAAEAVAAEPAPAEGET